MIYVLMTLIYKVENGNYCVLLMCVWKEKFFWVFMICLLHQACMSWYGKNALVYVVASIDVQYVSIEVNGHVHTTIGQNFEKNTT